MRLFRTLAAASAILMICACSSNMISTEIEKNEYETDYSIISTELLKINYPEDSAFAEKLNSEAKESQQVRVHGFEVDAEDSFDMRPENTKAELKTTQNVKYAKNNFLSVVEEEYSFLGGAHGMTMWNAKNIDFTKKKQIYLGDLFADQNYENILNNMIDNLLQTNKEEYSELWEHPRIQEEHQYNFYITDTDLVIYFHPYELSYYARGFVEFPLRLSELKGYLSEEYYFLAENKTE